VLELDANNAKCLFRMATAIWKMPDQSDT